jgi:hypothetical protein
LPPGLAFIEAWAALVRALAYYPESNSRIGVCVDTTLKAMADCRAPGPLRVLFARNSVSVGDRECVFAPATNANWLAERLDGCGLAGALFEPGLRASSLVTFCKQVLDSFRRSTLDPDFEYWSAEPVEHVHVLQRRFEGAFDAGVGTSEVEHSAGSVSGRSAVAPGVGTEDSVLSTKLLEDARIQARLVELSVHYGAEPGEVSVTLPAIELLGLLVDALPAEALNDPTVAVERTLLLLDEIHREGGADDRLGEAILNAGMRLFGRHLPQLDTDQPVRPIPAGVRGHDRDDAISDNLDELLAEIGTLPAPSKSDLHFKHMERTDEQLGVFLHYLVTLESEEQAEAVHTPLARLLRQAGEKEDPVLASYLEPLRDDAPRPASALHRRRVLEFLQEFDLTSLLIRFNAFTVSMARELFPEEFGVWLQSRNFDRDADRAELTGLLESLGAERILAAGPRLVSEARIADPVRARKLLARAHPALAPIARLILARGDSALKGVVALFVRKLENLGPEGCLLGLIPDEELPRDYLAGLLDPPRTPGARSMLHRRISETLCEFVEASAGNPARAAQRLAAVIHLGTFESEPSKVLLKGLLSSRHLLFLPAESAELRAAARQALASHA